MIDPERYAALGEELETCPACGYRCPGSYHYCPACGAAMVGGASLTSDRAQAAVHKRGAWPLGVRLLEVLAGLLLGLAVAWLLH